MMYAKTFGLLAVLMAATMAFAGASSATTLTSPEGVALGVGSVIKAESGHQVLDGTINITCGPSVFEGTVTNVGGGAPTQNVSGNISKLSISNCGNHTVTTQNTGTFSFESVGGGKATLKWSGTRITWLTHSLFLGTRHCIYVTNGTDVGTVTGGNPATHSIGSAPLPQEPTDSLCGNDAVWTGDYTFTSPKPLLID